MFWVWFEWQVFIKPHLFEADGDTIRLNKTSKFFWQAMPERYQGLATTLEVVLNL